MITKRSTALLLASLVAITLAAATPASAQRSTSEKAPPPPQLPKSFDAEGRYLVPDLDVDVPFTWTGNGGDSQMIAGGEKHPIHFTNVISGGFLYTLTYKWPGIDRLPCSRVGPFTLEDLNTFLESSRFVGRETLEDSKTRHVHHFRAGVVWEPPPEVIPPAVITPVGGAPAGGGAPTLRIPLMSGDFYVDQDDPTKFWKVLHFGVQNLYDPELDEWMVLDNFSHRKGTVELPEECATLPPPPSG